MELRPRIHLLFFPVLEYLGCAIPAGNHGGSRGPINLCLRSMRSSSLSPTDIDV